MRHSYWKWHTLYYHANCIHDPWISMLCTSIWKQYNVYGINICSSLECKHFSQPPIMGFVVKAVWNKVVIVPHQCTSFVGVPMVGLVWLMPVCICHWNMWIRNTSYMLIHGTSFSIRMIQQIILHTNICSILTVILSEVFGHFISVVCLSYEARWHITGQIPGNAQG